MKTAIFIDSLISRDETTILIELVLSLFPESDIYTIIHKRGGILGRIETRSIVSSFLTRKANDQKVFEKNFWILPSAVKGLPFDPSIENVIVLSRGYIHGFVFPPKVKSYLYIIDWNLIDQTKVGWQKMFAPYVNQWREKALARYHKIAVSSERLKSELCLPNAEVIQPTFRTEEFPFVKEVDHHFIFTHHLVFTHDLDMSEIAVLLKFLVSKKETVRVIGPDQHLGKLKMQLPEVEFIGDHCESTTAYFSHQAKAIWDFSKLFFPARALGAFCTGRPVVVRPTEVNQEYLVNGVFYLKDFSEATLEVIYAEVDSLYISFDRKALRRIGLKWNERLFKSRMVQFLKS